MSHPVFQPKEGQTDFTHIRYCPVINCVIQHEGEVLLVQRSSDMHFYPNTWNGVSGFIDDDKDLPVKVEEELREELGIEKEHIQSIELKDILLQDSPEYKKTWIVHVMSVQVSTQQTTLDWEAQQAKWMTPQEALKLDLLPGFREVLLTVFPACKA